MKICELNDKISNKTVLVRACLNVPLKKLGNHYTVMDDSRLQNMRKTVDWLLERGNKVVLMGYLGRPTAREEQYSMKHVFEYFKYVNWWPRINFCNETVGKKAEQMVDEMESGDILLLENVRFNPGESTNDPKYITQLAKLGDVFVNEAFADSHRKQASIYSIAKKLPAYGGFALIEEVKYLQNIVAKPKGPLVAIVGGAKISDKVDVIRNLARQADVVLVGGGVSNNFIKAEGVEIHKSYIQDTPADLKKAGKDYVRVAGDIIEENRFERFLKDGYIPLSKIVYPIDVVAAKNLDSTKTEVIDLHRDMPDTKNDKDIMYLDIGPKTARLYQEIILSAGTVFWNGPMGVFEKEQFANGTKEVARSVAKSAATTIVGGGDTITAVNQFHYEGRVDFISTGGGASLDFLTGKILPGIAVLEKNCIVGRQVNFCD
ncbi:MAG: phosphoglycerate kinase [Pseudomonadales bacterium]|jgi:phosphoglycerate kinase|nr:phosphoglycerate kinase [Pseudomonadales bacterium]